MSDYFFFFQAEDGIRDYKVTGVQTCALPIYHAVADSMIPADELSPSGTDCGVVTFIDRQLASAWGGGAKMYRGGPFRKARPEYGYQLSLTPKEVFSAGIDRKSVV